MRISGTGGRVRVGYQTAALVGQWRLYRTAARPTFEGTVEIELLNINPYWFQQHPQILELDVGHRRWIWPNITVPDAPQATLFLAGSPTIV